MAIAESLTKHRAIPDPPAWLFTLLTLAVGFYFAWNALRTDGPAISSERDVESLLRESREDTAVLEAATKALSANEPDAFRKLEAQRKAWTDREGRRQAERARQVTSARIWYGVAALSLWILGVWQFAARRTRA